MIRLKYKIFKGSISLTGVVFIVLLVGVIYASYKLATHDFGGDQRAIAQAPNGAISVLSFDYYFDPDDVQRLSLKSRNANIYAMSDHTVQFEPSNVQQQYYLINVDFTPFRNVSGFTGKHGYVGTGESPSMAILTLVTADKSDSFNIHMEMYSSTANSLKADFMLNDFQQRQLGFK